MTRVDEGGILLAVDQALYRLYGAARREGEQYERGWTDEQAWECGKATREAHDAVLALVRPLADALIALTSEAMAMEARDAARWRTVRDALDVVSAGPDSDYYVTSNFFIEPWPADLPLTPDGYADALARVPGEEGGA